MTLAEQIQTWDKEKEYVGYEHDCYFAVFIWQEDFYKIPFFVLEDLLSEMIREKREGRAVLGFFLNQWKNGTWNEQPIKMLKESLQKEMEGLQAYKMYDA